MLKYMYYDAKKNTCRKETGLNYTLPTNGDFVWILMEKPDEKEIEKVSKDFHLQKKYFDLYKKEKRSARYSINPLVFVFMDYYLEGENIRNSHILFVLKENALIIALPRMTQFHNELFDRLIQTLQESKIKNLGRLMHQFLLDDVNENYDVLDKVDEMIVYLEKNVASGSNNISMDTVVKTKRRIHMMSRRFWGSAKIIFVIKKGLTPLKVDQESMRLLDDVYDSYMHQVDILASYKDMLSDTLMLYTTKAANDLNVIIKRLTSFTVILMVPTMIASVYGMNFQYMPALHHELGFFGALALMLLSVVLLYMAFHRRKWI